MPSSGHRPLWGSLEASPASSCSWVAEGRASWITTPGGSQTVPSLETSTRTRETRTPTQRARIPIRTAECRAPRATQSTAPRDVAFPTAVARWASAALILAVSTGKRARRAPAATAVPPAGACGRSWASPAVRRTATVAVFLSRACRTLVPPTERPTRTSASWARKTASADTAERSARAALRYMTTASAYLKTEAPGAIAEIGTCGPGNCAGCCAQGGVCALGIQDFACGSSGAACEDCTVNDGLCAGTEPGSALQAPAACEYRVQ